MSKELADRLDNMTLFNGSDRPIIDEAIAALRSEPVAWMPIETAPKNHFPILVSGPDGRLVAFRDVTWAWWPFPASEALDYKPTHWMPLPAAPTRESRTDRQEPGLSAEQEVVALLEKNRQAAASRPSDDEMLSNTARHNVEVERHRAVENLCLEMARRVDAMALRSLTARDEGIEAAAKVFLRYHAVTQDQADFANAILRGVRALAQGQKESGQAIWSTVDLSKASTCPPDNRNRQGQRSEAESSPDISARTDEAQSSDHPTEQDADELLREATDALDNLAEMANMSVYDKLIRQLRAHLARKEQ